MLTGCSGLWVRFYVSFILYVSTFMQPFTVVYSASDIVLPHLSHIHISMNAQWERKTQISECRETVNSHILKSIDWRTDRTPVLRKKNG